MNLRPWKPSARHERDLWLKAALANGLAERTCQGYKQTTDKLLVAFPRLRYDRITEGHILDIIEAHHPRSRQRARAAFTTWFRWGVRTKRIKSDGNPMLYVPTYKQGKQVRPDVFSEAECAILCALPDPDGTLMAVLLGTGIRKSEARMLKVKRIDFDNAELFVTEGAKGGKDRVVPLVEPGLLQKLAGYVLTEGLGPEDYLWYTHPGGKAARSHTYQLSESAIHNWWHRCVDDLEGVRSRNLHATRHTFCTRWRRRGLDMGDTSRALGHADIKTTYQVYDHTSAIDLARKMAELV